MQDGYGSQQHGEVCRKDMESDSRKKCNRMNMDERGTVREVCRMDI